MRLTGFEIKKILKSPVATMAILAVLLLNLYMLLLGSQNFSYTGAGVYVPPYQTDIARQKQEGAYFKGEITGQWFEKYRAEAEAIRNDPANQVSQAEKAQIRQERYPQLTDEAFAQLGNFIYLKDSVMQSHEYQKYESMEVAARFHTYAARTGKTLAEAYRARYPGMKGETLAEKTESMYGFMADGYPAYYNYDLGYEKLRLMHTTYPLTVGLLILVALSPMFAAEYSAKTDALLLTAKHGKKRLIFAKLKAGILFAAASWIAIELINTLLVFGIYGTSGAEAYWQNWLIDWAPFPLNQLQITLVTIATSFLGAVFLAGVVMLISAFAKNQFTSLLIGGVILLLPTMTFAFANSEAFRILYNFLPANVLMGIVEWQWFDLAYLFGKAIPLQYIVLGVSALVLFASMAISFIAFQRHQVEN